MHSSSLQLLACELVYLIHPATAQIWLVPISVTKKPW